jgi:16S rRNA C967 or C1407 C5-methylase (RsmB/RsmF family)
MFNMAAVQWNMLSTSALCVREGGHLVYSTCSITLEENEMLIERFLKWHPEFALVDSMPWLGVQGFGGLDECQRLYPQLHDCNGFFVAKLVKEESS